MARMLSATETAGTPSDRLRREDAMDLDELRVFVSVVDRGSLAAASKSLRFPIATLRRRLNELEARLGVKLLERNRNGAIPTGAGVVLAERARSVLSDVQSLAELVRGAGATETGEVRMAIPLGMPPSLLATLLGLTMDLYPNVSWRMQSREDPASALPDDVHAAVCLTDRPREGPWAAKKLFVGRERLLASPAYLKRHGTPTRLAELKDHRVLVWDVPGRADELPLTNGEALPLRAAVRMNDVFLLRQAAVRGLGIALVPDAEIPGEFLLGDDALVRVLDEDVGRKLGMWLLASPKTFELPAIRIILEQTARLIAAFG